MDTFFLYRIYLKYMGIANEPLMVKKKIKKHGSEMDSSTILEEYNWGILILDYYLFFSMLSSYI